MHEHVAVAGERGREYGAKGWGYLKSAYATVASGVETVARDNGYKVDLGDPHNQTGERFCGNQSRHASQDNG
jgi:hypothetical protein